jgi:formylglycine-generating enzyme required for sulfatase activity
VNYNGNYPYRGNQKGQYREETVEVASLPANPWDCTRCTATSWTWCQNWYGDYTIDPEVDPTGPEAGEGRVLRGGSWISLGRLARSAFRSLNEPGIRIDRHGFRLALCPGF